ncbi:S8/S53 family peptidase [Nostoc sp. DedQUE09]|uniref:S8 family peptidase n=1 Tax=Nostoc sp. DedQUE09 TaxID=3075394 RepID=UPI002AD4A229|nr:S8/S53 family peptidase [Nostoc sp. DedQUE09]MDZ7955383.1 S8/S53 family peptidase [Nostoc sp. DedQUE09]
MKDNNSETQEIQDIQHAKLQAKFLGFTIQFIESEDKENILEAVAPYLECVNFNKNNNQHYSWYDCNPDLLEITITSESELSVAEAWDLTYLLRRLDKVSYVEPRFALLDPSDETKHSETDAGTNAEQNPSIIKTRRKFPIYRQRPITKNFPPNCEWHLEQMQVREAWQEFFGNHSRNAGKGIVIAHPDTGYLPHPELDRTLNLDQYNDGEKKDQYIEGGKEQITIEEVLNYVQENGDFPVALWHGTATASLMVSPEGQQIKDKKGKNFVTGVAPGATVKPYRLGPTSLDFEIFSPNLAQAINDAAENSEKENIRVISISLGGYPTLSVHRAIINAQRKGIIVVAAAGNRVPFAIWPAVYDKVIAVASSTFNQTIAKHSAIGSRVDVAAPGEFIYVATATKKDGKISYTVKPRTGTSYAAPLVAGVAALWLSRHGWDKLIEIYKIPARIPLVFDQLLRETCDQPAGWDTTNWGAGIVNAYELLKTELPDSDDPYIQEPLAYREVDHVRLDRGGVETFVHMFEQTLSDPTFFEGISVQILGESILKKLILKLDNSSKSALAQEIRSDAFQWAISKFLGKSGKDLRQFLRTFGREIVFYMGTDFQLYQRMENAFKRAAGLPSDNFGDDLGSVVRALKECSSDYLKKNLP